MKGCAHEAKMWTPPIDALSHEGEDNLGKCVCQLRSYLSEVAYGC